MHSWVGLCFCEQQFYTCVILRDVLRRVFHRRAMVPHSVCLHKIQGSRSVQALLNKGCTNPIFSISFEIFVGSGIGQTGTIQILTVVNVKLYKRQKTL